MVNSVVIIEVLKNARGDYLKITRINGGAVRSIILPGDNKKIGWSILMNKISRLMGRGN